MEAEPAAPGGSEGAKRATATNHALCGPDAEGTEVPLVSELWCAILAYANVAQQQRHGTLCQVWLPELKMDCSLALHTKGQPFCMAGIGDLLALFRCISCRYGFGTDASCPELLGGPGRVFTSGLPELAKEAPQQEGATSAATPPDRVHSVLVLPLFAERSRSRTVGVLEIVQTVPEMDVAQVITTMAAFLQKSGLYTCEPSVVPSAAPTRLQAAMHSLAKLALGESPRSTLVSPRSPPDKQPPPAPMRAGSGSTISSAHGTPRHLHRQDSDSEEEATSSYYGPYIYAPAWAKKQPQRSAAISMQARQGSCMPPPPPRAAAVASQMQAVASAAAAAAEQEAQPVCAAAGPDGFGHAPMQMQEAPALQQQLPAAASLTTSNSSFVDMMDEQDALQGGMGADSWDDLDMMFASDAAHGAALETSSLSGMAQQASVADTQPLQPRRRGRGSSGKPGKRLKREELEAHFGLGLRDAADRLGVCATTLKRACRRVGIQRWPRRLLPAGGGSSLGVQQGDGRWQALGQYMPQSGAPAAAAAAAAPMEVHYHQAGPLGAGMLPVPEMQQSHTMQPPQPQPQHQVLLQPLQQQNSGMPLPPPAVPQQMNCSAHGWSHGSQGSLAAADEGSFHGGAMFAGQSPAVTQGLMPAAQQQLAAWQPQVGLQQQASGGLPPLAATSPELSGLLSQLLQHLSQELGRPQSGVAPNQLLTLQQNGLGHAPPIPTMQAHPLMAHAWPQAKGLETARSVGSHASPPAPQQPQQGGSGNEDISAALQDFSRNTGSPPLVLPPGGEAFSLSFLGIDDLLDQEQGGGAPQGLLRGLGPYDMPM